MFLKVTRLGGGWLKENFDLALHNKISWHLTETRQMLIQICSQTCLEGLVQQKNSGGIVSLYKSHYLGTDSL
jgi:hypothetical protein